MTGGKGKEEIRLSGKEKYLIRVNPYQIVNDTIMMVQRTAHKLALEAWNYLQRWRKYSNLWSFDKNLAAEKYAATDPTLHQYDEKFSFYSNILDELVEMESTYNLYCIRCARVCVCVCAKKKFEIRNFEMVAST